MQVTPSIRSTREVHPIRIRGCDWAKLTHPYITTHLVRESKQMEEPTLTQPSPHHHTLTQPTPNPYHTLTQPSSNPHHTLTKYHHTQPSPKKHKTATTNPQPQNHMVNLNLNLNYKHHLNHNHGNLVSLCSKGGHLPNCTNCTTKGPKTFRKQCTNVKKRQ